MSDRGQKIFKLIVWIVIAALFVNRIFTIAKLVGDNSSLEEISISRNEWTTKLASGFGKPNLIKYDSNSDADISGEYAAITAMDAIGEDRLKYFTNEELSDQTKIDIALEHGVIDKKQLSKNITNKEADEIVLKTVDLYCDPDYYPEYFEAEPKVKIVDADRWDDMELDSSSDTIKASCDQNIPEAGEILFYTNEFGIVQAKYIDQVNKGENDKYSINYHNVDDVSEIFDSISFSGSSDFGYLVDDGEIVNDRNIKSDGIVMANSMIWNPFVTTAYAADNGTWEWFEDKTALKKEKNAKDTDKCDIEFNVELKENIKGEVDALSYIKITSNGSSEKYQYSVDDSGTGELSVYFSDDEEPDFSFSGSDDEVKKQDVKNKDENVKEGDNPDKKTDTAKKANIDKNKDAKDKEDKNDLTGETGIKANITLSNFGVCTSGYYQWADPDDSKNFVEVVASADCINMSTTANFSYEDKYKIGSIPIPIASTAGVISINVNFYLVVGADGEITIWYEIDDPHIGANVSVENGFRPIHSCSNKEAGVNASIELNGGIIVESEINVFGTVSLADPSVDVRAYASASTIDISEEYKLKEEYEGTSCIELKAQAPVIKLSASEDEDSLLYKILDTINTENSIDIIKKDSDSKLLQRIIYHVESDNGGDTTFIKLKDEQAHDDVCTHITKKTQDELEAEGLTEIVKKKSEKKMIEAQTAARQKAQEKIDAVINAMIADWMMQNCSGC